jgi:hypothetical protein
VKPPHQFTLGQLLKLIAVLAVCFAVIRMPFGPLVLGIGLILAGFASDRVRGGSGFRGGILAGFLGHLALGVFQRVNHQFLFDDPAALGLGLTVFLLMIYVIVGSIWGLLVSIPVWLVVSVNQAWSGEEPDGDTTARHDLEEPDLRHAQAAGPQT